MNILDKFKHMDSFKFFGWLIFLGSIFTIIYMVMTGNTNEVFKDFCLEVNYGYHVSFNKTAERNLIYILSFLGIFSYLVYYILTWNNKEQEKSKFFCNEKFPEIIFLMLGLITAFQYLTAYPNSILLSLFLFSAFILVIDRKNIIYRLVFFVINLYTLYAIERLLIHCGVDLNVNMAMIVIVAFVLSVAISLLQIGKNNLINKTILIEQLFLPALFLIYLLNQYNHCGEIIKIDTPIQVRVFIYTLIAVLVIEALYHILKCWKSNPNLNKIISIGSCIAIAGFNLYNFQGCVVPEDWHHPFENIIGFHQIFIMGQHPFTEWIPTSGLHSVIQGAVHQFFGNGLLSTYNITENIYYLLIILLAVLLLNLNINRIGVFFISFIFYVMIYSRIAFILPIMLILSTPKLIDKPNTWLKVWILTSVFHILYYPSNGVAVCFAFVPLAIYLFTNYLKTEEFKTSIKTFEFWFNWILCFIPVLLSMPLLLGTYRHIKAMADQTILADSMPRFAQKFGDSFLPFINSDTIVRQVIIYLISFIIPAAFVWVAFSLTLKVLKTKNIKNACIALSLVIVPLISFSWAIVRLETYAIFARLTGILLATSVMLFIFSWRFLKDKQARYRLFCFALFIPMFASSFGFFYNESKSDKYYWIPCNYELIKSDYINKVGTGFANQETMSYLHNNVVKNKVFPYYAISVFLKHYYNDLKGAAVIETFTTRGYSAAKEVIDVLRKTNSIVGCDLDLRGVYYVSRWLLTSGEYIYNERDGLFYPNKRYSYQQALDTNKNAPISWDGITVSNYPNSLGLSMSSLMPIYIISGTKFDKQIEGNTLVINFAEQINGNSADFMYIDFADMDKNYQLGIYDGEGVHIVGNNSKLAKYFLRKIYNHDKHLRLEWSDDNGDVHDMYSNMGQGKLLIPLGSGNQWLLNNHKYLKITVLSNGEPIEVPQINSIRFLKLRDIY